MLEVNTPAPFSHRLAMRMGGGDPSPLPAKIILLQRRYLVLELSS